MLRIKFSSKGSLISLTVIALEEKEISYPKDMNLGNHLYSIKIHSYTSHQNQLEIWTKIKKNTKTKTKTKIRLRVFTKCRK